MENIVLSKNYILQYCTRNNLSNSIFSTDQIKFWMKRQKLVAWSWLFALEKRRKCWQNDDICFPYCLLFILCGRPKRIPSHSTCFVYRINILSYTCCSKRRAEYMHAIYLLHVDSRVQRWLCFLKMRRSLQEYTVDAQNDLSHFKKNMLRGPLL